MMSRRSNNEMVELDAILIHQTEKGIKLDFNGEEGRDAGQWFSKSVVSFSGNKATMPEWLAKKEGLI